MKSSSPSLNLSKSPHNLEIISNSVFISTGDANRIIKQGGVHINYEKVTDPDAKIEIGKHVLPQNITLLQTGESVVIIQNSVLLCYKQVSLI